MCVCRFRRGKRERNAILYTTQLNCGMKAEKAYCTLDRAERRKHACLRIPSVPIHYEGRVYVTHSYTLRYYTRSEMIDEKEMRNYPHELRSFTIIGIRRIEFVTNCKMVLFCSSFWYGTRLPVVDRDNNRVLSFSYVSDKVSVIIRFTICWRRGRRRLRRILIIISRASDAREIRIFILPSQRTGCLILTEELRFALCNTRLLYDDNTRFYFFFLYSVSL